MFLLLLFTRVIVFLRKVGTKRITPTTLYTI
ncbi:hypothetical protein T12_15003 [Trichinella patagoniensis]|uniref:Uncharacterized protein n=1 Tax=Trichinella patagoniensis TaxID=990121 RepID=A0A0V0YYJ7_9BILA|nr:hypothetical protein T12_15003 [Trichinella patagoniensis]